MKTTDFALRLSEFLSIYLPGQKGLSTNTIMSYRDTFRFILIFSEDVMKIPTEKLTLTKFNCEFIVAFLTWLEKERKNSVATRNQRLAAINSFVKFVKRKNPEYLAEAQKILDIDFKRKPQSGIKYLTPDCVQAIISATDTNPKNGKRDKVLLSLLYDSAARVQELCDLKVRDIRLQKPYAVTLTGKGRKTRSEPIMVQTSAVLTRYIAENRLDSQEKLDYPLFVNHHRTKLTRAGVAHILKKYCDIARQTNPDIPDKISPHVLRHSKAMHMLGAGINLIYIRDFLGHNQVKTTEIYAKADPETKRAVIEGADIHIEENLPPWNEDKPLMQYLRDLCGKD